MTYINHSGGCPGADMTWEILGYDYGVTSIAYSFWNHVQEGKNPRKLTVEELNEGFNHVITAAKSINRNIYGIAPYVQNLLSRNWFQVKNAEAIYPIGKFMDDRQTKVQGGTGWAVQMAVDNYKRIYLFEQNIGSWFSYDYVNKKFAQYDGIPTLTKEFAGIGTREINDAGILAIQEIYEHTFR